jgi:hypothetical protein
MSLRLNAAILAIAAFLFSLGALRAETGPPTDTLAVHSILDAAESSSSR